ncbi:MAG: glycosyltransferase [Planctomycetota bacterium]
MSISRQNSHQSSRATVAFVPREVFSTTKRSLETLLERTHEPIDLVCIDGASPPPVAAYLKQTAAERGFTLLRSDRYLTPNQARNLAAEWALAKLPSPNLVFVDNDVLVTPGWIDGLVDCAEETGAGVVGPAYFEHLPERQRLHMFGGTCRIDVDDQGRRIYHERHDLAHTPINQVGQPLTRHETELIEFHTVLVRREVFEQVGLFDEGFFCTSEHGDLCLSARKAGFSIWVDPDAQITYAPPRRLDPADREFFFLRWSDAWTTATHKRMVEKWGLDVVPNTHGRGLDWVRGHRRLGLQSPRMLRKIVGPRLGRSLEKRVIAPLDNIANRHRYPLDVYGELQEPKMSVVYSPTSQRQAA